jgi:heat shock protein HslJ
VNPTALLHGPIWVLTAMPGASLSLMGVTVTAEVRDGRLSGTSGCNRYTTSVTVDDDADGLTVGSAIAGTRMICDEASNTVEAAFLERLPLVCAYVVDGTELTLVDAARMPLLVFEASDQRLEIHGPWDLINYHRGDAVVSVKAGSAPTAEFDDTTVHGSTGVNRFHGPYTVAGDGLEIGPLAVTARASIDPDLSDQEHHYLRSLGAARAFRVVGDQLTLLRDGGTIAATFDRSIDAQGAASSASPNTKR